MKFVMSLFIIKHVAAFFTLHPVIAPICVVAYAVGGVMLFKLKGNTNSNNKKLFTWAYILLYSLPATLGFIIVCADLLFIPLYIHDENAYTNVYGYFIGLGILIIVVPFAIGFLKAMASHDFPELGAP